MGNKQQDEPIRTWDEFERKYFPNGVEDRRRDNETSQEAGIRIVSEVLDEFKRRLDNA